MGTCPLSLSDVLRDSRSGRSGSLALANGDAERETRGRENVGGASVSDLVLSGEAEAEMASLGEDNGEIYGEEIGRGDCAGDEAVEGL